MIRKQIGTTDSGTNQTISFTYDAASQRVQRVVAGGATTVDVHDVFWQLAAEYSTVVLTLACTTCYLSYDGIGSVRMITDQNGADAEWRGIASRAGWPRQWQQIRQQWECGANVHRPGTGRRDGEFGLLPCAASECGAAKRPPVTLP